MNEKKDKKKNGKSGFFAVCAACLIALGIAGWSAYDVLAPAKIKDDALGYDSKQQTEQKDETDSSQEQISQSEPDALPEQPEQTAEQPKDEQAATSADFFIMPIKGEITKNFNDKELQYSETYGDMRIHIGIDIAAENDSGVTSCGNGKVTGIQKSTTLGNTVTIDHGNGITAKYCGLSEKLNVAVGDVVDSKSVIGTVAEIPCESVEKSHLHLEIYKDGAPVSPLLMFGME